MSLSKRDNERLVGVVPSLVAALNTLFAEQADKGRPMFVVEGLRTTERQQFLFAQNTEHHVVTQADGVKVKSNHQAHVDGFGHAVDVAFVATKGHGSFDNSWPWQELGAFAQARPGMRWGGTFSFRDLDHLEMT